MDGATHDDVIRCWCCDRMFCYQDDYDAHWVSYTRRPSPNCQPTSVLLKLGLVQIDCGCWLFSVPRVNKEPKMTHREQVQKLEVIRRSLLGDE